VRRATPILALALLAAGCSSGSPVSQKSLTVGVEAAPPPPRGALVLGGESGSRAVALAVLRDNHRVTLSTTLTAGYGSDREGALQACLERVREGLEKRRFPQLHRSARRPEASL